MKRTWKPLDVGGLRLYMVYIRWRYQHLNTGEWRWWKNERVVAARSPGQARRIMHKIYEENKKDLRDFQITSGALNINMPESWCSDGAPCYGVRTGTCYKGKCPCKKAGETP